MRKYLTVIKIEMQRQLAYRLDAYAYRLSNLLEVFALLFVWKIAYRNTDIISGYSHTEMVTYVLIGWLFMYLSRNYGFHSKVEEDIAEGRISDFLVKPISYLRYMFVLSLGRSSIALLSSVVIQAAVIIFFRQYIVFNLDFWRQH